MLLESCLIGTAAIARRRGGLWRYLTARAKGRTAVELERERNRATIEALRQLPPGCELLEYEREGRLRVIRPATSPGSLGLAGRQPPETGGELCR